MKRKYEKHTVRAGDRFGKLTVVKPSEYVSKSGKKQDGFLCVCDCGNEKIVNKTNLVSGKTKSCGCLIREFNSNRAQFYPNCVKKIKSYGIERKKIDRIYNIYRHMKQRCYNPNTANYKNYGGRGIKICDEWLENKNSFIDWSLNNGYKEGLSIDRIDVNGDYTPENCRWADRYTQANNTRANTFIYYNGRKYTVTQLSEILSIERHILSVLSRHNLQIFDRKE